MRLPLPPCTNSDAGLLVFVWVKQGKPTKLESRFKLSYNMILNLLRQEGPLCEWLSLWFGSLGDWGCCQLLKPISMSIARWLFVPPAVLLISVGVVTD